MLKLFVRFSFAVLVGTLTISFEGWSNGARADDATDMLKRLGATP